MPVPRSWRPQNARRERTRARRRTPSALRVRGLPPRLEDGIVLCAWRPAGAVHFLAKTLVLPALSQAITS